ncbi:MAG: hypothetical protein ABFR47_09180 [Verrucomicrobiota bacterium]
MKHNPTETNRRTLVKSLLWRLIGIVWTWTGAYFIILLIPESKAKASLAATGIVAYHHSTRMVMYYFYERLWGRIAWGRTENPTPTSPREKLFWTAGTLAVLGLIFYLLLVITPMIKGK